MEKQPNLETETKKIEYVERFLTLMNRAKEIDEEMMSIYNNIQTECGTTVEQAIKEREIKSGLDLGLI